MPNRRHCFVTYFALHSLIGFLSFLLAINSRGNGYLLGAGGISNWVGVSRVEFYQRIRKTVIQVFRVLYTVPAGNMFLSNLQVDCFLIT